MDHHLLVKNCLRGDAAAQKQLYELFAGAMLGVCYRYTKSMVDAEDVLQEGFIMVFRNLYQFSFSGELGGWIRRIMVNTAINYLKKNSRYQSDLSFRDGDLHPDSGVVLLETKVVVLEVVELGKTAILPVEGDLWSPEIASFAEGGFAFRVCNGISRIDCWTGDQCCGGREVRRVSCECRNAAGSGTEGLCRKTYETCKMGLVGDGLIFGTESRQTDLCGGEAGSGEIDRGVLAGVETVLNDANEAVGETLLLLESGLALQVAIEREIGDSGVLSYAFSNVLEVEVGCI